jgi:excisionase family DNA binding protein
MYENAIAQTMSVSDVSEIVGVSTRTIKRWCAAGKFVTPVTGAGMHWRFRKADINAWLSAANEVGKAQHEFLAFLDTLSRDQSASLRERRWASETHAMLREGIISFDDLIAANERTG